MPKKWTNPQRIYRKTFEALVLGDFRAIGYLINIAPEEAKGRILGMLSFEIYLRKRNKRVALHVLNMARKYFIDDYKALLFYKEQEKSMNEMSNRDDLINEVIKRRNRNYNQLRKKI